MKVFIGVGHGGSDPGAVKYLVEKDVNLTMALACEELLKANGVDVKLSRYKDENDKLSEEIKEANDFNADIAVDIHNNAGGGDGFEAYYSIVGGTSKELAKNLEAEVIKLGQNSRGCKTRLNDKGSDYYGFIREIKCPSVIVEGLFIDNSNDVQIGNTVEKQKAFGYAYARGILKTLGIEERKTEDNKKSLEDVAREVIAGKWGNGAIRKKNLENAGYKYIDVQVKVNELMGKAPANKVEATYETYTVKKGDTLYNIAKAKLGKGSRYTEIKALNGLTSDTIYPGNVLKLPR